MKISWFFSLSTLKYLSVTECNTWNANKDIWIVLYLLSAHIPLFTAEFKESKHSINLKQKLTSLTSLILTYANVWESTNNDIGGNYFSKIVQYIPLDFEILLYPFLELIHINTRLPIFVILINLVIWGFSLIISLWSRWSKSMLERSNGLPIRNEYSRSKKMATFKRMCKDLIFPTICSWSL